MTRVDGDAHNRTTAILTNYCGLQVHKYRSWNMMPRAPSIKESVEWVVTRVRFCRTVQKDTIRTDAMLKAEELPAGVSSLDTCLAHMDRDAFSLDRKKKNNTDRS